MWEAKSSLSKKSNMQTAEQVVLLYDDERNHFQSLPYLATENLNKLHACQLLLPKCSFSLAEHRQWLTEQRLKFRLNHANNLMQKMESDVAIESMKSMYPIDISILRSKTAQNQALHIWNLPRFENGESFADLADNLDISFYVGTTGQVNPTSEFWRWLLCDINPILLPCSGSKRKFNRLEVVERLLFVPVEIFASFSSGGTMAHAIETQLHVMTRVLPLGIRLNHSIGAGVRIPKQSVFGAFLSIIPGLLQNACVTETSITPN